MDTPPRSKTAIFSLAALACLHSSLTVAQWSPSATANLGMGYGQIALGQSILSGSRLGAATAPAGAGSKPPAAAANDLRPMKLTYTPDPALSDHLRATMVDALSKATPQSRSQIEQAFAGNAVLKQFDRYMSARGYSSRNVADDMAEWMLLSWQIVSSSTADTNQIHGVHQQVRSILLGTAKLGVLQDADRQQMAERIAYQVIIASSADANFRRTGDGARLSQLQQQAAAAMRQEGIDISRLHLTNQGFKRNL